jgi:uncharacterized membrane protein YfcA
MILTWLGALAIGLALGLLGSGGSILTVPVLIYLAGQDEKTAIAGSLFIVGMIAAFGGLQFAWKRMVDWRTVVLFGLPGMAGTYLGAWLGGLVSGTFQLAVFATVMLLAAGLMFKPPVTGRKNNGVRNGWKVAVDGLGVGLLTGFVGVGGGFLIVPALVILGGLPMHLAIGTSLVVIALKSFTGFVKYLDVLGDLGLSLDWNILAIISGVGIAGSFAGRLLGTRVSQSRLQRLFGGFLVVIGMLILWQTLPKVL